MLEILYFLPEELCFVHVWKLATREGLQREWKRPSYSFSRARLNLGPHARGALQHGHTLVASFLYVCVLTCGVDVCVRAQVCGGQRLTSYASLNCSPPYFLRQGLLLNQELAVLAKQATCLFPPPLFPPELQAHITMRIFSVGAGNLNSDSSACIANTSPTELPST